MQGSMEMVVQSPKQEDEKSDFEDFELNKLDKMQENMRAIDVNPCKVYTNLPKYESSNHQRV